MKIVWLNVLAVVATAASLTIELTTSHELGWTALLAFLLGTNLSAIVFYPYWRKPLHLK